MITGLTSLIVDGTSDDLAIWSGVSAESEGLAGTSESNFSIVP